MTVELPAIPELEFSQQWHEYMISQREYIKSLQEQIEALETEEEEEQELPNQIVQAITDYATGTASGTHAAFTEFVVADGEVDLVEISINATAGNKIRVEAAYDIMSANNGSGLDIRLYVDGTMVQDMQYGTQTTDDNPNNYKFFTYLVDAVGPMTFKMTTEGVGVTTFYYHSQGGCNLTVLEIKE